MWAQLITAQLHPGKDSDLAASIELQEAAELPGSGLVRSIVMRDQNDPSRLLFLVVFENEEKARAREKSPERLEALKPIRAMMSQMFAGPPEFIDLAVVNETIGQ
jgi:quinol monooxygenase YgiN